jgi:DNA-binding Lrp family transcriptional regulator
MNLADAGNEAELSADERAMIGLLQQDGRRSFSDMARELGVGESTVRRTVHRLIEDDVIAVTAVANPRLLGLESIAWVGIRIDWRAAKGIQEALLELRGVDYVVTTTGRYHVMAEVSAHNLEDFAERIDVIRGLPGVRETESFLYLDLFHQEYQWAGTEAAAARSKRAERPRALSEFDQRVVIELRRDGRRSFRQIGRELDVPEHRVRAAYSSLVDQGILRVMAVVNPARLGFQVMAWIGFRADPSVAAADVAQSIADHRSVDYVVICTGRYDVMAEMVCRSQAELAQIVERELGALPGVESLEAFPYLDLKYHDERVWSAGRVSALER